MNFSVPKPGGDYEKRLKWLMLFRVIFCSLLLGSTIIFQFVNTQSPFAIPLLLLYGLVVLIFFFSVIYALLIYFFSLNLVIFAYFQICIDTIIVSLIIYLTGNFSSIFNFLYLVIIIYASIFLFRQGSLIIAAICGIQYGMLVDFEYYGLIQPYISDGHLLASQQSFGEIIYKIINTMIACFAVSLMASLLSEQEKKTQAQLNAIRDRVKHVEKMAAIGEMAAGLAHEIRNPMASLTGSIQLLKSDFDFGVGYQKLMQIIEREADRLNNLVTNFLLFAKPPQGNSVIMELGNAIEETIDLFEKDKICTNRIDFEQHLIEDCLIKMDSSHLRQILLNIFMNAAEAIENSGKIIIRMKIEKKKNCIVIIDDTGKGIVQTDRNSIFDPFFTTKVHGTGLGLSIVHRILESYEASINIQNGPIQGTRVTLTFPLFMQPTSS